MHTILSLLLYPILFFMAHQTPETVLSNKSIQGAWVQETGSVRNIFLVTSGYFSITTYDQLNKKFMGTWGGTWKMSDNSFQSVVEFNSTQKEKVGQAMSFPLSVTGDQMKAAPEGKESDWKRIDNGDLHLHGCWHITGRQQEGEMKTITPGARKTVKIMSSTRFQWAALNSQTGEFFGTGGGHYTFENGKYTEHIEFFSRDSSRVGMSLSFDGRIDAGNWHHSGKSSKGDAISEIWTRVE